jgi:hypothetical protein
MRYQIIGAEILKQLEKDYYRIFNPTFYLAIANEARNVIYRRVKSGYGVNKDNLPPGKTDLVKLAALSPAYIKYRRDGTVEFYTKDGKAVFFRVRPPVLGEWGSPERSNLTLTGQMLNSLRVDVNQEGFSIVVPPTKRYDSKYTNAQIAEFVSDQRPFLAFTEGEVRIIAQFMELYIKNRLKNYI